jgi:hypothetical protein
MLDIMSHSLALAQIDTKSDALKHLRSPNQVLYISFSAWMGIGPSSAEYALGVKHSPALLEISNGKQGLKPEPCICIGLFAPLLPIYER